MGLIFASASLRMVRGTTWTDTVQLLDTVTGEPVNLAGVTAAIMRVRRSINSPSAYLELSLANDQLAITDAGLGHIGISVAAIDTLALPRNGNRKARYVYDCVLSRGGDPEQVEPGYKGKLTVDPQTTRYLPEPT